jgi:hypothetical protein
LIRKEHVDVAMEFSRCARARVEHALREGRSSRTRHRAVVRHDTVLQSSTACGRPSRGPTT